MVTFGNLVINSKDFYIEKKWSGLDELVMEISINDEIFPSLVEEAALTYNGRDYLIKAIDRGIQKATIKAQLDVDEWRENMLISYNSGSESITGIIGGVIPDGWDALDMTSITARRTIKMDAGTPLDVITQIQNTFRIVPEFDTKTKTLTIYNPDEVEPLGAFIMEDLNLKSLNFKGNSTGFATRLYCFGKDNITFEDINDGKPYIDNFSYSNKVVCAYWKDERYTNPETLLEDGRERLKQMAVPQQSYTCQVIDLANTNPETYGFQDFSLMQKVQLCDRITGRMVTHQIIQTREYPYYPEKNVITLSTLPPKVTSEVAQIRETVKTLPTSGMLETAVQEATDMLTERVTEGNVIDLYDSNNHRYGIAFMDTADPATAQNVWLYSANGWGYSSNGLNGPFTIAATMNGTIVADMIKAGTLQGVRIIAENGEVGGFAISANDLTIDFTYNYPTFTNEDLAKLQAYILGSGTLTDEEKILYDVNLDGHLSSADLLAMQKMILGTADTYASGTITISSENPREAIVAEVKQGYGAGRKTVIGIGGIRTTGVISASTFASGENDGITSSTIATIGRDYKIRGGILTDSSTNSLGTKITGATISPAVNRSLLPTVWRTMATLTLAAGTWLIFYNGSITGAGYATFRMSTDTTNDRQSITGDGNATYTCSGVSMAKLYASTNVTLQAQGTEGLVVEDPNMYAVQIG